MHGSLATHCRCICPSIAGSFRTGNIDAMSVSRYSHAKESKTRVQRKTRDAQKEVSHLTFIGCPCAKKGVNNVMLIIVSRRERTHAFSLSYDKHRVFKTVAGRVRAPGQYWCRGCSHRSSRMGQTWSSPPLDDQIWSDYRREKRRSAHTAKTKY